MPSVDQWTSIEESLGGAWDEVQLSFVIEDSGSVAEGTSVLAPLGPGRTGSELRFQVTRRGGGPQKLRNLLRRLDRKRVWGTLTLVGSHLEARIEPPPPPGRSLAATWDVALAELPPDWSDLLCELELDSTDYLPRAALLGAPLNPTRHPEAIALRFRVSGKQGYGASAGMARRCLERMDAEGITGKVIVLHALSDTENAVTQGPVWRIAGRSL